MKLFSRSIQRVIQQSIASLLGFLLTCGIAFAQELATLQKITPAEAQELRNLLQQPQPEGMTYSSLDQWYQARDAAAFRLGDPVERERVLRAWLAASPGIDPKWTLGSFLMSNSNNSAEGFALMEQVLAEQKHPVHMVRIRSRIAEGYIEEHQLKKAQALLDEAEPLIAREFGRFRGNQIGYWSVRAEMEFHKTKARLLTRQGHFDAAIDEAKLAQAKGLELRKSENLAPPRQIQYGRSGHASSAVEVAVAQINSGRLFEAEESLREALAIFKSYQFTEDQMVFFYRWVSDLYFAQGRYDDGLRVANRVREVQLKSGLSDGTAQSIWTRMRINKSLVAQGRWKEALQEFDTIDQAVGTNDRIRPIARMVDLRGLTLLNNGRASEAANIFRGSLDWSVNNFGANHYFTAFKRGLYGMALAQESGRQATALNELEQAIRDLSAPETLSTQFEETPFRLALRQDIYKTYIRLLVSTQANNPNAAAQAFAASNHLMASGVQQAISEAAARAAIKKPGLGEVARLDQDAKTELTSLYSYIVAQTGETQQQKVNPEVVKAMRLRLTELEGLRRKYKAQIQKEFPEYFQLLQPKAPTPEEVAKLLGPKDVFVSLIPMEDETYIFGIGNDGKTRLHRSKLNKQQIAQLVKTIRTTLDVADLGPKAPRFRFDEAHRLYKELLGPLEDLMTGKDHLIVATSGALGQLPFAVLVKQPWTKTDYTQAPWLVRDMAISHVSSPNAWASLKKLGQTPSGTKPLMAWGDPTFALNNSSDANKHSVRSVLTQRSARGDLEKNAVDQLRYATLPPLPETKDEVLALAKVLNANNATDVYLGEAATRESVIKASDNNSLFDRQIIVFATHGLLPGDLPKLEQPALAMSATADPNGSPLLTLEDVMGLRLNADWVVLSACNTAGADGKVEEALSGLARGFFYAGSRSLLVTHWSVESESAMRLTTKTFELYKSQNQLSRAQALRMSMLNLMQTSTYAHPTYWAPYALVGEGSR
jgi:CHAT domain-containing protein